MVQSGHKDMHPASLQDAAGEIYIEMIPMGRYVKVNAICARTGFEVTMVGDPRVSDQQLRQLAARKLRHVMKRNEEQGQTASPLPSTRRGIIS